MLASSHVGAYLRSDAASAQGEPGGGRLFLAQNEEALRQNGGGEWLFASLVLSNVPGLDFADVQYQVPFRDCFDGQRYADFVIRLSSGRFLALEVDGWDKKQTGAGMDRADFNDFLTRQNGLIAAGYQVLRFSNEQVRNDAAGCVSQIHFCIVSDSVAGLGGGGLGARVDPVQYLNTIRQERERLAAERRALQAEQFKRVVSAADGSVFKQPVSNSTVGDVPYWWQCACFVIGAYGFGWFAHVMGLYGR